MRAAGSTAAKDAAGCRAGFSRRGRKAGGAGVGRAPARHPPRFHAGGTAMLSLKHTGAEILAQGSVLKADEFAAVLEARDIVARAHEEAARIGADARQKYETEKERGYREGL